jgi:uncharacterized hydrophobic protein (TIGR00271 family)
MQLRTRIQHVLGVSSRSKPGVYMKVYEGGEFATDYALELLLGAGIATLGLVLNSPAVVIGAMLVSPLMGPILATGLALAASDVYLGVKSLINIIISVILSVLLSALLVWVLPFHTPTAEVLARTQPNLLDLGVALFSGLAGALLVCRGGGGGGTMALPGVAIAVALLPPLCTIGFGVGSGLDWAIIKGASLLFLTNLAAIVACAFLVFLLLRMDAVDIRDTIREAELEQVTHDPLYGLLKKTVLRRSFGEIGQLRWRVLMLVVTLAILFFPLRKSLLQVRDESIARTAVRDGLRLLGPPDAFLTQQLEILPDRILARLVVTMAIDPAKIREAERLVIARTGKPTNFVVRQVVSQDEIALLKAEMAAPAPAPPPSPPPRPADVETLGTDLLARLEGPLKQSWPAALGTLVGYEIGFTPNGAVVRIRYEAAKAIAPSATDVLTQVLKTSLKLENLQLIAEREPLQRVSKKKK